MFSNIFRQAQVKSIYSSSRAFSKKLVPRAKYPVQSSTFPVKKTTAEWKEQLTPGQYDVLRSSGTERPHTGIYDGFYPTKGTFACAGCDSPLYTASSKFNAHCGWPAFDTAIKGAVLTRTDETLPGIIRIEILCQNCGGHLGHVFPGEKLTETNERHCVNSASLTFDETSRIDTEQEDTVLEFSA